MLPEHCRSLTVWLTFKSICLGCDFIRSLLYPCFLIRSHSPLRNDIVCSPQIPHWLDRNAGCCFPKTQLGCILTCTVKLLLIEKKKTKTRCFPLPRIPFFKGQGWDHYPGVSWQRKEKEENTCRAPRPLSQFLRSLLLASASNGLGSGTCLPPSERTIWL